MVVSQLIVCVLRSKYQNEYDGKKKEEKLKFQEWFVEHIVKNTHLLADNTRWDQLLASYQNGIIEGLKRAKAQYEKNNEI